MQLTVKIYQPMAASLPQLVRETEARRLNTTNGAVRVCKRLFTCDYGTAVSKSSSYQKLGRISGAEVRSRRQSLKSFSNLCESPFRLVRASSYFFDLTLDSLKVW
jgi:hypothetical protein